MRSDGGRKTGIRNSGIRQQQESKRESGAKCRTNLEIADKPGPMISPNHAQHLGRPVLLVVSKIIFLVYEALVNPPPPPPEVSHAHQNRTQNVSTSTKLTNMTHQTSCQKKMKSMSIPQLPLKYRTPHFQTKASVSFHLDWHTGDRYDGFRGISQHS